MKLRRDKKTKRLDAGAVDDPRNPSVPAAAPVPGEATPGAGAAGDRPASVDVADVAEIAEIAEIAEAMYRAAQARMAAAEAREQAAAERESIANMRDRTSHERESIAHMRDRTSHERESIANMRDRTSHERDTIANMRDRTSHERDTITNPRDGAVEQRTSAAGRALRRDGVIEIVDEAALERARLEAELQRAHLDALTGTFRREVGRLALRNEIERARRSDGKFIIAFVDVDGLKGVNDREGHAAGDHVLRTLAATMRANLRSYDPIVRYGGDEFICGISSIGHDEAQHRIGVIDQSLRQATGVGITVGLASLTSNETLEDLTARADAALLEAKRSRD